MKKCLVMGTALAGLLACLPGAPGRDVPVYREYTQPIVFYNEQGQLTSFNGGAPDLLALQALRDTKAQEGLMGRETLLDLMFEGGGSVLGMRMPVANMAPASTEEPKARRKQGETGRFWLADSLTLPSLGQTRTNAAEAVMTSGTKESSWGWLADEVAEQSGDHPPLPEEMHPEGEIAAAQMDPTASSDVSGVDRMGAKAGTGPDPTESPVTVEKGRGPSDRTVEPSRTASRDPPGGGWVAPASMPGQPPASAVADMSQTRQIINELSPAMRPDFAALRESLVSAPGRPQPAPIPGLGPNALVKPSGMDLPPSATSSGAGFSLAGPGRTAGSTPITPSWRGGWGGLNAEKPGSSSWGIRSDPVPAPIIPATPGGTIRPGSSSGGYKPAWY